MAGYSVDIAALSKIPFSEQSQLTELSAAFTFFWSGRPKTEQHVAGVVSDVRNDIVGRLSRLLQGIINRLISLRVPLQRARFAANTSVYVPR
ncbi:hypothetical protein SprV_0401502200 [Sparganum proliferum]